MKAVLFTLIALAAATPLVARHEPEKVATIVPVNVCAGTSGSAAKCCATDVLGLADLNCVSPPKTPLSVKEFTESCSKIGQQAKCCNIPLLGQALICSSPVGA